MLLNSFCFLPVNLSFIIGMSQPRTQKGGEKITHPTFHPQSNRLYHTDEASGVCSKLYHLGLSEFRLRCFHKDKTT